MPMGRNRRDDESDGGTGEQGTVGTFETLRDEGEHFVHVKQFERAIESFSKALEMKAGDKTCLVTRSKCYLMLGNSAKALTDAEAALENDEEESKGKDIRALCMKAEALYQKGDFETALVYYHRGHKLRPELQEFRLGIQKSQEAINNSIGTPDAVRLEASGDLTFFYKAEEKSKQQKGTYNKPSQMQRREEKKDRTKPQDGGTSKTTKQLLGELYNDRAFLEKLYDGLTCSQSKEQDRERNATDRYIKDRAVDGLEYLTRRADFWRQQKPMYARARDRRRQQQQQSARSRGGDQDPMQYILERLEEIDEAQASGKYKQSLKKSEKTLDKVEAWGDEKIKNRPALVANLYSCMGNAHLEMGSYKEAIDFHNKDLAIGTEHGIDESESRALDNLGRTKARMGKYEDAIELWEKKLPKSKSALESTWLFHEIGRCHLELGQNQDAKDYGEKSLAAAQEADDCGWQLHATVLIAQAEVKCEELQAAADSFERAREMAEKLNDSSAQAAIKKALEEVNNRIVRGVNDDQADDHHDNKDDKDDGRKSAASNKSDKSDKKDPASRKAPEPASRKTTEVSNNSTAVEKTPPEDKTDAAPSDSKDKEEAAQAEEETDTKTPDPHPAETSPVPKQEPAPSPVQDDDTDAVGERPGSAMNRRVLVCWCHLDSSCCRKALGGRPASAKPGSRPRSRFIDIVRQTSSKRPQSASTPSQRSLTARQRSAGRATSGKRPQGSPPGRLQGSPGGGQNRRKVRWNSSPSLHTAAKEQQSKESMPKFGQPGRANSAAQPGKPNCRGHHVCDHDGHTPKLTRTSPRGVAWDLPPSPHSSVQGKQLKESPPKFSQTGRPTSAAQSQKQSSEGRRVSQEVCLHRPKQANGSLPQNTSAHRQAERLSRNQLSHKESGPIIKKSHSPLTSSNRIANGVMLGSVMEPRAASPRPKTARAKSARQSGPDFETRPAGARTRHNAVKSKSQTTAAKAPPLRKSCLKPERDPVLATQRVGDSPGTSPAPENGNPFPVWFADDSDSDNAGDGRVYRPDDDSNDDDLYSFFGLNRDSNLSVDMDAGEFQRRCAEQGGPHRPCPSLKKRVSKLTAATSLELMHIHAARQVSESDTVFALADQRNRLKDHSNQSIRSDSRLRRWVYDACQNNPSRNSSSDMDFPPSSLDDIPVQHLSRDCSDMADDIHLPHPPVRHLSADYTQSGPDIHLPRPPVQHLSADYTQSGPDIHLPDPPVQHVSADYTQSDEDMNCSSAPTHPGALGSSSSAEGPDSPEEDPEHVGDDGDSSSSGPRGRRKPGAVQARNNTARLPDGREGSRRVGRRVPAHRAQSQSGRPAGSGRRDARSAPLGCDIGARLKNAWLLFDEERFHRQSPLSPYAKPAKRSARRKRAKSTSSCSHQGKR